MNELIKFLQQLERDRFFGSVELVFKAGDLELIRKQQTIKLQAQSKRDSLNGNYPQ